MELRLKTVAFAVALALSLAGAASACTTRPPAEAQRRAVSAGDIDMALLDAAVRAEINRERCQRGLSPLEPGGRGLIRTATAHSRWMVSAGDLTHNGSAAGRRTVGDRIRAAGVRYRRGAENVGYLSLYRIDGAPFRILDASACRFASYAGEPLGVHSYATLARSMVAMLMRSPGHRRNILDRRVDRVATGVAYDRTGPYCGLIWFTQSFVG